MNSWTLEQRLCLDVLWTYRSHLSYAERARVFNHIFKSHLLSCGLEAGLTPSAISCQYSERHYTDRSSWKGTWARVCSKSPDPEIVDMREQLKCRIDAVLQDTDTIEVATPPSHPAPTTPRRRAQSTREGSSERNPYATPGLNIKKRTFTAVTARQDDSDTDIEYLPSPKRAKQRSPAVIVPPTPKTPTPRIATQTPSTAITPRSAGKATKYRSGGRKGATILYHRPYGAPIWLTPAEYAETQLPLKDVSEEAAHPTPPALLYRYWDDGSHGL